MEKIKVKWSKFEKIDGNKISFVGWLVKLEQHHGYAVNQYGELDVLHISEFTCIDQEEL